MPGQPSSRHPAPPTATGVRPPLRLGASGRLAAGVIACGILAVLIIAARLQADPAGHGTHQQLGLPPCGWVVAMGRPCPTCGMTTAFCHMAHLRPGASFNANPIGSALALASGAGFWIALHAALTGSRGVVLLNRLLVPRVLWTVAVVWAASWVYKIVTWPG